MPINYLLVFEIDHLKGIARFTGTILDSSSLERRVMKW